MFTDYARKGHFNYDSCEQCEAGQHEEKSRFDLW